MKQHCAILIVLTLAAGAAPASDNPYTPMAWLVKRCWAGTLPDGKRDQHCYGWEYGGKFIRDSHVVSGGEDPDYRGQTLYAWDADLGRITFWYWTNVGSVSTGEVHVEGEVLVFPEQHVLEDGRRMALRSEIHRLGDDQYRSLTRRRFDDGEWETLWDVIYTDLRSQAHQAAPIQVPAGQHWSLVFNAERDGDYNPIRVELDGSGATALSTFEGTDWIYAGGRALIGLSARDRSNGGREHHMYRVSPDGKWTRIGDQPAPDSQMGLSPDGEQLVVSRGSRDEAELFIIDRNGHTLRQLTDNACQDTDPHWSPDGRLLVFRRRCAGGASELWLMALESSATRALTDNPDNDQEQGYGGEGPARWSPDGERIAWMSWSDGDWEIHVMRADGTNPKALTSNDASDGYPSWSPDGRYIAFSSDRDGDYEIYVMDADGSNPRRVTVMPGMDLAPVWLEQ